MTDTPKVHKPWVPKKDPWLSPDYDDRVIYAVRAFANGTASPAQQAIVWRWIAYITEVDGLPYRAGTEGQRDTDFALGKMFVGQQIRKMLHPELTPPDQPAPPAPKRKRNA